MFLHEGLPEHEARLQEAIPEHKALDCAICFEDVSKANKAFALLPNCDHVFCMDCVVVWRKSAAEQQGKSKCPVCRSPVNLVAPSRVMLFGEEKKTEIRRYINSLSIRNCKFFNRETGISKCPFGPQCYFGHFNLAGEDVKATECVLVNNERRRRDSMQRNRRPTHSIMTQNDLDFLDDMFLPQDYDNEQEDDDGDDSSYSDDEEMLEELIFNILSSRHLV